MLPVEPELDRPGRTEKAAGVRGSRLASVDALRGLVMIIMALDHTRDYFHADSLLFQPEDLSRTNSALFFTRWVTHICAPVFMFLAGTGAYFWQRRGRTTAQLSRFLWTRGLWLMLLEVTVLRVAMNFSLFQGPLFLTVLWALGLSMVVLGFLVWLPLRALAVVSLLTIALHNLTDGISPASLGSAAWIWNVLHQPGFFQAAGVPVIVGYPLIPWFAVMAAGYCFGQVLTMEQGTRRTRLLQIGFAATAAFFVIRAINVYGDPFPWTDKIPGMTLLSFLRATKYPPSLDFLLMTLGPAILLLAAFDRSRFARNHLLIVFGRTPLFYFLGHFFLVHALTVPLALARYGRADFLFGPLPGLGGTGFPTDYGYSLATVYLVWIVVVLLMYPLCAWFARLKQRRNDWWLSYL